MRAAAAARPAVERLAPAKINLALHVLGRRPDGYHELDTLAVFADVGDRIAVRPADVLSLSVGGPMADHAPGGEENLVLKAASALRAHARYPGGAEIRLEKHLPAGAGLGGGSADAAAALEALNLLWDLGASRDELSSVGGPLGADIPMCTASRALRARGTGERIETLDGWPALPMVLVWPGRPTSTPEVFRAMDRRDNPCLDDPPPIGTVAGYAAWLGQCRNDLQTPAVGLVPEIGQALDALRSTPGCLLARMSGSGSACFGIYADMAEAHAAAELVKRSRPRWWIAAASAR